ncbi:MAG: hypothetical protein Q7J72_07110 [Candidatus Omnitrophota bacterium]|nr:hypothetical protein [Candidatus Omnitrophota bacterium]
MKRVFIFSLFIFSATSIFAQEQNSKIRNFLSSGGKVLYGNEQNSIVVIDYPDNIERVKEYLNMIDVPPRQVMIEARVVEVKLQKEHALGVNWQLLADKKHMPFGQYELGSSSGLGQFADGLKQNISYKNTNYPPISGTTSESPFTFGIFDENINVILQTLANSLDTNVLSAPRVATVNNREAVIKVIQSLPWAEPDIQVSGDSGSVTVSWKINFEEVGIILKTTPIINDDGNITMVLNPEISDKTSDYSLTVTQGTTSIPYTVPVIDKRTASTKVVVKNGQTLIIGGLIKEKITKGETKIPLLGDIPFLGYLFKSKKDTVDKTELLIFISPTIITPDESVRMRKNKQFGLGKSFDEEKQKQEGRLLALDVAQKAKETTQTIGRLKALTERQSNLLKERKELEEKIRLEEENSKENK